MTTANNSANTRAPRALGMSSAPTTPTLLHLLDIGFVVCRAWVLRKIFTTLMLAYCVFPGQMWMSHLLSSISGHWGQAVSLIIIFSFLQCTCWPLKAFISWGAFAYLFPSSMETPCTWRLEGLLTTNLQCLYLAHGKHSRNIYWLTGMAQSILRLPIPAWIY